MGTEAAVTRGDPKVEHRKNGNGNGNGSGEDVVVLISRLDYGSDGSRVGLLHQVKEIAEKRKANFIILAGGLISYRACRDTAGRIRDSQKKRQDEFRDKRKTVEGEIAELQRRIKGKSPNGKLYKTLSIEIKRKQQQVLDFVAKIAENKPQTIGEILKQMTSSIAEQFNNDLPLIQRADGERMKIHIVTSRAYDGDMGREVVKKLIRLRRKQNDIRYESSRHPENTTFKIPLKKSGRTFAVVVPTKAVWRSAYYSTNADRLLEDEMKRTTKQLCDVYAVGCGASSINRGHGEMPYQRITVPALCRLEDPRTSENMVGVGVLTFAKNHENCPYEVISLKDMVSNEGSFVSAPEGASEIEKSIVEEIKVVPGAEASLGMLEDRLGVSRFKIEKALKNIMSQTPRILDYDDESQKYFLSQNFLQRQVRYSWPSDPMVKEVLAGFACLHTGSIHTAYDFVINDMPELLFKHEVSHLLMVGDCVQGLKHDLQLQGEIVLGMNNTVQEKSAGAMIATVLLKVLDMRLMRVLSSCSQEYKNKMTSVDVETLIRFNLQDFLYWIGNHDDWSRAHGYDPLDTMEGSLRSALYSGVSKIISKFGLARPGNLAEIVDSKVHPIQNNDCYRMPSGLLVGGRHYYAGRTKTSSQWCQRGLGQIKQVKKTSGDGKRKAEKISANLCWIANFHVEESVAEWSAEYGLRVAMQVPTLMSMSKFEDSKGKVTDFGFGLLKVWSIGGRAISAETNFLGLNPHYSFDNNELIRGFLDGLGIGEWVDLKKLIKK